MPHVRRRRAAQFADSEWAHRVRNSGRHRLELAPGRCLSFPESAIELCDGRRSDVEQQGPASGVAVTAAVCQDCRYRRAVGSASTGTSFRKALQGPDPPECRHSNRVERRTFTRPVLCPIEFDRRAAY
jgi:hypothetical protein